MRDGSDKGVESMVPIRPATTLPGKWTRGDSERVAAPVLVHQSVRQAVQWKETTNAPPLGYGFGVGADTGWPSNAMADIGAAAALPVGVIVNRV